MRLRAAGALALAAALLLGACSSPAPSGPRLVTTEEAQLLAVLRFKNFDAGTRSVTSSFVDAGTDLDLTGWFDYASDTGYGELDALGTPNSLILWNSTAIAAHDPSGGAVLPPPDADPLLTAAWRTAVLSPRESTLHSLVAVIESLGSDRPENPLLLQQGGALWLRTDVIDDTAVTVFAGPTSTDGAASTSTAIDPDASNLHYWVNKDGLLLRLEVRLGSTWVTVDFGDADGVSIANPFSAAAQ